VRLVLDSSFVIDVLNGDPAAADRWRRIFDDGDEPILCETVVCEVRTGLREDEVEHIRALLDVVEFVPPSAQAAILAGEWRAGARSWGRTLSLADSLIAAAASATGAAVLTRNVRDFALTPIRIEAY
jgi:predicted nucleic acid-binding protein